MARDCRFVAGRKKSLQPPQPFCKDMPRCATHAYHSGRRHMNIPIPFLHSTEQPARRALNSSLQVRLAQSPADLRAAQALRFEVFNLELDEGLATSYDTGLDADPYDEVCDHLLVEDLAEGRVVGTYRLQTGHRAAQGLGFFIGFGNPLPASDAALGGSRQYVDFAFHCWLNIEGELRPDL
eukprot:gene8556-11597_t